MATRTIVQKFYQHAMGGFSYYCHQELKIAPGHDYKVVRASDEPRFLGVLIQINPRYLGKLNKIAMQEELAMAMGLPGDQHLRIGRGPAGTISLEIPKPETLCITITARQLPRRAGVVGIDTRRKPTAVDFTNPATAHALVAGITGSGKTNTQKLLAWSQAVHNAPEQLQMVMIDVEKKGRQWGDFAGLPHLAHPIIVDQDEARAALAWAVSDYDQRRQTNRVLPKLFLFIDELQSLVEVGGCVEPLERLARVGREYGIHLVVATQHPTIEALGSATLRRNLAIRLVSRVDDATAAHVATGQKGSGAELLTGPGDSLLVQPGLKTRLTVALLKPQDTELLARVGEPKRLPLDLDVDRILDVVPDLHPSQLAEPHTMEQLAYALATNQGVNKLQRRFEIGGGRASRLKSDADGLRDELWQLGKTICDVEDCEAEG